MASVFFEAMVPQVVAKTVGTTAVQVSTVTQLVMSFTVEANSSNSGILYLGGSNVDATAALRLSAGDSYTSPVIYAGGTNVREYDLSEWYLRASGAGQKAAILKIRLAKNV